MNKDKILIITSSFDFTVDYIIKTYDQVDFFRFNIDLFSDYITEIKNNPFEYSISNNSHTIHSSEIKSIYFRKPLTPKYVNIQKEFKSIASSSILKLICGLAESFEGKCITKPSILYAAENKILQLKLAEGLGFNIPKSLISNNSYKYSENFKNSRKTVFKLLTNSGFEIDNNQYTLGTSVIDKCEDFVGINQVPIYFQEYCEKEYEYRITIVGDKIFSVKLHTQDYEISKIDWRLAPLQFKYEIDDIPEELKNRCLLLMSMLKIEFGAFDFIFKNDVFYFLEVNPNGQWLWLEKILNIPISKGIVKLLNE